MSILSGLTHIERCLFPGDFKKELKKLGMDNFDAQYFSDMVKNGKSIVECYQYAETCNEPYRTYFCKILNKYVDDWMMQFKHLEKDRI